MKVLTDIQHSQALDALDYMHKLLMDRGVDVGDRCEIADEIRELPDYDVIFSDLVEQWRGGVPVTSLCYSLNNDHMEALDKITN